MPRSEDSPPPASTGVPDRNMSWPQRCEFLFEDLRKPARAMVSRAYGRALADDEIDDVYSSAWTATLSALRGRGQAMSDKELRSYVLTAVASHASKEMRRRSRKPVGAFEETHEQAVSDPHQPLPEERAIGNESGSVARDLLASLPKRRRAVMLLRYGWGMAPAEVCSLVAGLSPRAYRKEVTKGVEQLIEKLAQVESGEWCRSREPIIREYVAGTGGEDVERQAVQHLSHCRGCADLVARLNQHLHELGGPLAVASLTDVIDDRKLGLVDRISGLLDRGREGAANAVDRGEATATAIASSGGARGSGAAGLGIAAKLGGLGAAGKAAIACVSAGAAATACLATGVVPGISLPDGEEKPDRPAQTRAAHDPASRGRGPVAPDAISEVTPVDVGPKPAAPPNGGGGDGDKGGNGNGDGESKRPEPQPAPVDTVAPTAPPQEQEFGLPSTEAASTPPASSSGSSGSGSSSAGGTSDGAGASGSDISREFGP